MQRKAWISMQECADHVPVDVPNEQAKVTHLMDSIKLTDPMVLAALAAIRQDELDKRDVSEPPNNGSVLNISKILKAVMSSAAEAKLGALYINASKAVPMHQLLTEMGHKQPKTPIQTDNTTECGVVNNNIQPRRTKAMNMRFHWLRCRDSQGQFRYYWGPGINNRADYWTKRHCAAHHIEKRPEILTSKFILNALRASIQ